MPIPVTMVGRRIGWGPANFRFPGDLTAFLTRLDRLFGRCFDLPLDARARNEIGITNYVSSSGQEKS